MSNKKEYAIGDTVQVGLLTLVCREYVYKYAWYHKCMHCDIYDIHKGMEFMCKAFMGDCKAECRTDQKDVIFRLREE